VVVGVVLLLMLIQADQVVVVQYLMLLHKEFNLLNQVNQVLMDLEMQAVDLEDLLVMVAAVAEVLVLQEVLDLAQPEE
jgi:hypothetical protein